MPAPEQAHEEWDERDASAHGSRRARRPRNAWSVPGQVVMGPSFYVWDESAKQARDWGVELANAWLARER